LTLSFIFFLLVLKTADIVFLVASSNASSPYVKTFISKTINSLPLGPNEYRAALAQFSDQVYNEFHLDTYKGKNQMLNHIKSKLVFKGGPLKTGNALRKIQESVYWKSITGQNRSKILIVMTPQPSEDDVKEAAQMLQKSGVKTVALGMENASHDELFLIATKPYSFFFPIMEELSLFSQNISGIIVDALHTDPSNNGTALEACDADAVADVAFIVDVGSSQTNIEKIQIFLEKLVSSLDVKDKCMRIGLVTYSNKPQATSLLRMATDKTHVLQSIQSISPKGGKANLGSVIHFTKEKVFSKSAGSRKSQGVEQIAIVITHRSSEDDVSGAATALRRAGVTIFAIGIDAANTTQLAQIVAYPPEKHLTRLKTFSHLPNKTQIFHKKIMNQIQQKLYLDAKRAELLKRGCVDTEEADIYFLIGGSSSMNYFDFADLKLFLKEVVKFFMVGPNKVRFGVVQYAEINELEFGPEEYGKTSDILKAIENIRQLRGNPHTGKALKFIHPLLRKSQGQHSRNVPCHLVVLTDQISEDPVKEPAKKLKNEMVSIYAIGIRHANESQIYEIAESKDRAYFVNDFASLKHIRNEVVRDICAVEACKEKKSDILFLVDSSRSISPDNFLKMKDFMSELVNKSDIGLDRMHVGAIQFSSRNKEEFRLSQYATKSDIIRAIGRMSLMGQSTLTGGALQFVLDYFRPIKGSRPYVKKILILITDGEAQDDVKTPAEALRQEGIIVYSVGVFNANRTQLVEISGKPEMVFYVEDFDILKHLENEILFGICSPYDECRRIERLDIVFVIDGSGSIDPKEYDIMKEFMISLVKKSDVSHDRVQFGAVKYSAEPETFFYLNRYTTKSAIIRAIQNDKSIGETTYTAKALRHSEGLFSEEHGSRKHRGVPQVLIVITDGDSHDAAELDEVSKKLRANGIIIYAIGIERARPDELLTMAGSEDKYFYVNTFEGLKHLYPRISEKICSVSKPECGIPADLVFLIDGSNSISDSDFTKMKNFLQDVVRPFDTGHNVQVGIAQYSDRYRKEFSLNMFSHKLELETQIGRIRQMEGLQTYIGAALDRVRNFFTPEGGSRVNENIQQILLVITDGRSHDKVVKAAEDLRKKGVDIYAIGVGRIDHLQLSQIAGSSDRKYTVDNFSELKVIKKRLVDDICEEEDKTTCFMDVVVGIDVSSQKQGDRVFQGQYQLESRLPQIVSALTSLTGVSCKPGSQSQTSVALQVKNTDPPVASKFQIDSEKLLNSLEGTTIQNATHLNVEFLNSLWETFQMKSANRRKVLLIFSDGLDDRIEILEEKSEELREKGLDALITVVLEGPSNFNDLQYIEFGKGFEYKTQLNIGMRNIDSQLIKYMTNIAERTCCCVFCKCIGDAGEAGEEGRYGMEVRRTNFILCMDLNYIGTAQASECCSFTTLDFNFLLNLSRVFKDLKEALDMQEMKGDVGDTGIPGEHGPKGIRGQKNSFSVLPIALFCMLGRLECPVYPTELVFALDVSHDTTPQLFQRMKEIVIEVVNNTKIRESNCPEGARVAVVSYSSDTDHLIRFSDFHRKRQLIQELAALSYQRLANKADLGRSMRYVARNIFKRTLPGATVRKVAVFFSSGQSVNLNSINTAILEFSAFDIVLAAITFNSTSEINRALTMDDSEKFQVITIPRRGDYTPFLHKLLLCTLCYDKCNPNLACEHTRRNQPPWAYVDIAFILDSSWKMNPSEFEKLGSFLSRALDNFVVSSDPVISSLGDRVAIVSHAPSLFQTQIQKNPVKKEFDLVTYGETRLMKKHIQESLQHLGGAPAVGHAIQWTLNHIFSSAPSPRKHKVIVVISAGESSPWDKDLLKKVSLRAKCQGYALLVLSLGPTYNTTELEEVASPPLEQHLIQLGRIHKPDLDYALQFLKTFLHLLRSKYFIHDFKTAHSWGKTLSTLLWDGWVVCTCVWGLGRKKEHLFALGVHFFKNIWMPLRN
uniref:VWFA domain-containing protein n=1 Tax=Anolis carolinensis TaxID=28377 RepID=G1KAT1_ANOCA